MCRKRFTSRQRHRKNSFSHSTSRVNTLAERTNEQVSKWTRTLAFHLQDDENDLQRFRLCTCIQTLRKHRATRRERDQNSALWRNTKAINGQWVHWHNRSNRNTHRCSRSILWLLLFILFVYCAFDRRARNILYFVRRFICVSHSHPMLRFLRAQSSQTPSRRSLQFGQSDPRIQWTCHSWRFRARRKNRENKFRNNA